ncbi:uncharacterized protein LOC117895003 [Drosophila subobscura]|uniref:uncharacterized protein LOC117895003 n=1 Tax=Drosophila subobscura TaxID=7241 RepID=UPI00155A90B4|nr:uncharacterized protein LOC117895003 [Drosophila subobscura]
MESHASAAQGFCLCHLMSVWHTIGRIGLYLGYYNVGYAEQQRRFLCDEQLYVHLMALVNLLASLAYLSLSQLWIYDPFVFLLYVPLYVYFLLLRRHFTELLNECATIHRKIQRILGTLLCVRIRRECFYTLALIVMFILLLSWQLRMYSFYQSCFIGGVAFIYHLELLFFGSYLLWLSCLYRSLNTFLLQHMRSDRMGILRGLLREQSSIWRVHRRVSRYFGLHFVSFMAMPGLRLLLMLQPGAGQQLSLQLIYMLILLLLLALLLLIALNLQRQQSSFQRNFLRLRDDPNYFVLKSWRLLQHRTLPQAFGVTLMRRRQYLKRQQDIVTIMFSTNFAATQLVAQPLLLASVGCKSCLLTLTLATFRTLLVTHLRELLLLLTLRLLFYKHFHLYENGDDFHIDSNGNVTQTISQVYRFYFYDEFE